MVIADPAQLPDDVDALKRMITAMARDAVYARTLIDKLRFELARFKRHQFGASSEKLDGRVGQLELAIEALEADEAESAASLDTPEAASPDKGSKPARRPLPDHLPREEVIHPGPCACPSCGGRLRRIGSDATETLDYVPGRFKVVRHVREAFSCRACDTVVQAPAPFHAIARGRAGPGLLAHIVVAKFDDHLPLYRQAEIFAREGVTLETSTLSGWVGATAAALKPLVELLARSQGISPTCSSGDILRRAAGRWLRRLQWPVREQTYRRGGVLGPDHPNTIVPWATRWVQDQAVDATE